jgi:hypothetical protein
MDILAPCARTAGASPGARSLGRTGETPPMVGRPEGRRPPGVVRRACGPVPDSSWNRPAWRTRVHSGPSSGARRATGNRSPIRQTRRPIPVWVVHTSHAGPGHDSGRPPVNQALRRQRVSQATTAGSAAAGSLHARGKPARVLFFVMFADGWVHRQSLASVGGGAGARRIVPGAGPPGIVGRLPTRLSPMVLHWPAWENPAHHARVPPDGRRT